VGPGDAQKGGDFLNFGTKRMKISLRDFSSGEDVGEKRIGIPDGRWEAALEFMKEVKRRGLRAVWDRDLIAERQKNRGQSLKCLEKSAKL